MASLGEMAAGMAHEINTPLTAINLRASKLRLLIDRSRIQEPDRLAMQEETSKILDTTFRISKIISSLRTFSNPHEGEPFELAEVERIILDTLDLCSQRLRIAGIKVQLEVAPNLQVHCRPSEISQILLNLLNNAYDAVDAWAKSQDQPLDRWIRIQAQKENDRIRILVSNPGHPIPESHQDKLFEPFFTTKRLGKGTGLGLSISRALMENHGGSLSWLPKEPQTTFCMELPVRHSTFMTGLATALPSKDPEGTT